MTIRRILLFAALLAHLPSMQGCNLVHAKEGKVPSGPMKKISIGRLDLQVPADAELKMLGQVNEAHLVMDHLNNGETFAALWAQRLKKIASGTGNDPDPGKTVIRKTYPATADHGQVYYEQGKDPRILVVMERWQMVGNILVKGREEFEPRYLQDVERDMEATFSHISTQPPTSGEDFAFGPITVHLQTEGAEEADASVSMALPGKGSEPVKAQLSLHSVVLSSPGSITILPRAKQAIQDAPADAQVKLLRASKRIVNGMDGEESILTYAHNGQTVSGLRAEWGTPGKASDYHAPQTELRFGVTDSKDLDVPVTLGYWDAMLASARYRR